MCEVHAADTECGHMRWAETGLSTLEFWDLVIYEGRLGGIHCHYLDANLSRACIHKD